MNLSKNQKSASKELCSNFDLLINEHEHVKKDKLDRFEKECKSILVNLNDTLIEESNVIFESQKWNKDLRKGYLNKPVNYFSFIFFSLIFSLKSVKKTI